MRELSLGFSPCPNDTFIFYALVHRLLSPRGVSFAETVQDVETLNRMVLRGELDVSKVSCALLGHIREEYVLLRSGGALGRGCGPLLVAREPLDPGRLRGKRIVAPGEHTTAFMLLRLFDPALENIRFLPFDRIMGTVAAGEADAGLIIHESRFTYPQHGLVKLLDLGEWWERETGKPIPLGGIVARRSLGSETLRSVEQALRESVEYSFARPEEARPYIRRHSQEMDDATCDAHISLYVNDFTVAMGSDGEGGVETLVGRGVEAGIFPASDTPLLLL